MEEIEDRKKAGEELLRDHLGHIKESAEAFLGALKGFRRDLLLSSQATGRSIVFEFSETPTILMIPSLSEKTGFPDLSKTLSLCAQALFGSISVSFSGTPPKDARTILLEEIELIHKNLADVSELANRLYESIKTAGFEFDVFNTQNIEADHRECNVLFDRDALNVSMETARALGEAVVRLDIDLMESKKRFE